MKNTNETLIANLVRFRKKLGTQASFAAKVGLSLRGYQKYEQGESFADTEMIGRFSTVIGCEPWELLFDTSTRTISNESLQHQLLQPDDQKIRINQNQSLIEFVADVASENKRLAAELADLRNKTTSSPQFELAGDENEILHFWRKAGRLSKAVCGYLISAGNLKKYQADCDAVLDSLRAGEIARHERISEQMKNGRIAPAKSRKSTVTLLSELKEKISR